MSRDQKDPRAERGRWELSFTSRDPSSGLLPRPDYLLSDKGIRGALERYWGRVDSGTSADLVAEEGPERTKFEWVSQRESATIPQTLSERMSGENCGRRAWGRGSWAVAASAAQPVQDSLLAPTATA
eukprot:g26182.t1